MRISLLEFATRGLWEALTFVISVLSFCRIKIGGNKLKFIILTVFFAVMVFLIRLLPISFGVHTMLILVVLDIIIMMSYKVKIEDLIKNTVIVSCMLFLSEALNALVLTFTHGKKLDVIINDPIKKIYYFTPSIIMFMACNFIIYMIFYKKRNVKDNTQEGGDDTKNIGEIG